MKIAIISPNAQHLEDMSQALRSRSQQVLVFEGGKSRMRQVAEHDLPEVLLVDGMCCDPGELSLVEQVTTLHPGIAVVLLCSTMSPEFLLNAMRAGVREVLPSPPGVEALHAAIDRVAAKRPAAAAQSSGKVLAFMPCKGGAGTTFLATNLAWQLSEHASVLLIDLNLQFGDALSFVSDETPTSTIADVARDIHRVDASFLAASAVTVTTNLRVLAAPEDPSAAMEVKPEHIDAILNLATRHYDFVVLDLPRQLDTLSIHALDRAQHVFPVLQAALPDLRNAVKLLRIFRSLDYANEKIELLVNRFDKAGEIGSPELRKSLGGVGQRVIPDAAKEVAAAVNRGVPLAKLTRNSAVVRALGEMATALLPQQDDQRGLLQRLFRRA
ncbi:MAG: AAA family ATPase [Proteobacteria bacterium]|nr:AAA family ATPase [Pseudomonadota bacterium]